MGSYIVEEVYSDYTLSFENQDLLTHVISWTRLYIDLNKFLKLGIKS